jgi:A/G-specific adenine glycosylase
VEELPPPKARPARRALEVASALCERRGRVLLARRPGQGLFGGLWELPSVELGGGVPAVDAVRALFQPAPRAVVPVGAVQRTLTHRELSIQVFRVDLPGRFRLSGAGGADRRWSRPDELDGLGISSATRKALDLCLAPSQRRVR